MRTIDSFVQRGMHAMCNFTYRKFGVDNYIVGIVIFVLAFCTSVWIYFTAQEMAVHNISQRVAQFRIQGGQFGAFFFGGMALVAIIISRPMRYYLQMAHDTKTTDTQPLEVIIIPWAFVSMYILNLGFASMGQNTWTNMLDCALIGIGFMFLRSKPPTMEDRMKKEIPGW